MGGHDNLGNSTKKVEMFVPAENDWNSFDNLNDEREGLAAVVLNNELYVMGGSNGSANILDSVELLDTAEEKWEYSSDWTLDVPRALFASVTIDDYAYSIGGFSSFGPMGLVQGYDEEDGTANLASLVPGRGGLSAVVLDESIYVMGGRRSNNQVVNNVDRFFPDENRWEQVPGMQTERERFAAISFDDKIFVFGGNSNSGAILNTVEVFATSVVPAPADDLLITAEDTDMSINVLVNDIDPAGGSLTISSFSQPQHGVVTQINANTFNYEPEADFFGNDQFTYTALNETGGTAQATVNVTVQPVNDPPAFDSSPVTGAAQNTLYTYTIVASDVDNDALAFESVEVPAWLSLTAMQNGEALLQGTPTENDLGDHALVIAANDGVESVEQNFTITVVDGAPTEVMLISPADGAKDLAQTLTLSWEVPGASTYDLEVSLDAAFTSLVVDEAGLTNAVFELQGLDVNQMYYWRVRGVNAAGSSIWSASFEFQTALDTGFEAELPEQLFALHANYPNPFSASTTIVFELNTPAASVQLEIFDLQGRQVIVLDTGFAGIGEHRVQWDGRDAAGVPVASGSYVVRLQLGTELQGIVQQTRLIMLVR